MGLIDDIAGAARSGADAAGRAGQAARLRARLAELRRRRERACAELGASLYEAARADDDALRGGREALFDAVAAVDAEAAEAEAALAALAAPGPEGPRCASCGAPLREGDAFCMACGARVAPGPGDREAEPARRCPECGAEAPAGTAFCGVCGARLADDGVREDDVPAASGGEE